MKAVGLSVVFIAFCSICGADVPFPSYEELVSFDLRKLNPKPQRNNTYKLLELKSVINQVHDVTFLKSLVDSNDGFLRSSTEDGPNLLADNYTVSEGCRESWNQTMTALTINEFWALKMIDASAKIEPGILDGHSKWLGSYDECFNLEAPVKHFYFEPVETQFCFAQIPAKLQYIPLEIDMGLCVPKACSPRDIMKLYNDLFATIERFRPTANPIRVKRVYCPEKPEIDTRAIVAIVILGIFAALILSSTAYDVIVKHWLRQPEVNSSKPALLEQSAETALHNEKSPLLMQDRANIKQKEDSTLEKLILSFSAFSNGKKILQVNQSAGTLTALNGIRFLSISWVVLGHTYAFSMNDASNTSSAYQEIKRWTFQAVSNALVSVDSFFALSGLLLSYLTLKAMKNGHGRLRINWFMFYFHRFWRLTPVYMIMIMISACLSRYFGDGPLWPKNGFEPDFCKDTWWRNLLYINNLFNKKQCFGVSWYLANDMQFFVITPLMLIPLYFHYPLGIGVCFVWLLGSAIAPGVVSNVLDLPPSSFGGGGSPEGRGDYFNNYYIRPHCRIGPYIVGIIVGSLLYKTDCKVKINKFLNLLLWLIFATLAILVLYGLRNPINYPEDALNRDVSALYNATHKIVWGACVCWVIFACATGNGGFINTLLSWSPFVPLARLSYCIYLTHAMVIWTFLGMQRTNIYIDDINTIYLFLGHLVLSCMTAFVASVSFEAPMMGLEKILLKRPSHK
ncbi:nose resistant to fluoxetine protein 6-like [Saccostrea cucullata]|uniref:nose resistant to fluoxetine protein 6-like n=1 Tax=Saccostrea cuccullata TaxID=36930 RepID=UPI002ED05E40